MHKEFSEWYRLAGIEPIGETLIKRWAAIEEYSPNQNDIISLAQLFYRRGKPSPTFLSDFTSVFQKTDPTFKIRDNDHELSVLAGALLIHIIEDFETDLADMSALSLVSAAAGNMRPSPSVVDIPEIATRYLAKRSINRISDIQSDASQKKLIDALNALGSPHGDVAKELLRLNRKLSIVDEECNMLWWLFSEHSRDGNEHWSKFSAPSIALRAGKELADLTHVIPGPLAAPAFLDRTIRYAKPKLTSNITIKDAINNTPIDWRQKYIEPNSLTVLEDLIPISYGIKLSTTSPENDSWLPAFKQRTGISADIKIAPYVLAYQVYIELLLDRSWNQLK